MTSTVSHSARHFDTIVLGAGTSGLACASKLFQHEKYTAEHALLVLEARGRLGGRVGTVTLEGARLDTGANWIHGIGTEDNPNPLMKILPHKKYKQLCGTVIFQADAEIDDRNTTSGKDNGTEVEGQHDRTAKTHTRDKVISSTTAGPLLSSLWQTIGELHEKAEEMPANTAKETTVLQGLVDSNSLRQAFKDVPKEFHTTLSVLPQFVEVMEAGPLVAKSAEHEEGRPGMSLLEFAIDDFEGDQVFLEDGYSAIIDELATDLIRSDRIKLSTEVKSIDWSDKPISIETSKGTYTADNVVCTLPLGVLKHLATSSVSVDYPLFRPELPFEKQESIRSLGFGTLDKIFLVYTHPWWLDQPYASIIKKGIVRRPFDSDTAESDTTLDRSETAPDSFMGFTNELQGIAIHNNGETSSGPRSLSIMNLHNLTGFPVLSAFVSCANAPHVENMTDSQAQDLLQRTLTSWFGQDTPQPTAVHVTRWASDEYSRGSYSHMITGLSETRHREVFQEPIVNGAGAVLRFAGEHTSRNHFATVHGALLSGWREADAILSH